MTPRARAATPAKKAVSRTKAPDGLQAKKPANRVGAVGEDRDEVGMSITFDETDEPVEPDEIIDGNNGNDQEQGRVEPGTIVGADGKPMVGAVVPFKDRMIPVAVPDEVQLAVIKMFSEEFGDIKEGDRVPLNKAVAMSKRAIMCVQSVMVEEEDREWIGEGLLSHRVRLDEAINILQDAMRLLRIANVPDTNRAGRRAAKKAKLVTNA